MAQGSTIEWTESTWNPVSGLTKISPGCKHCYARRVAIRLHAMGQPNCERGFNVSLQEHMLELPLTWRKPQTVFVNSMGDLFHREVPDPSSGATLGSGLDNLLFGISTSRSACKHREE